MWLAATFLAWLLFLAAQVDVQKLTNTGVLFEPIGTALLYQDKWTIFSQVTFEDVTDSLNFVKECESVIEKLCNLQPQHFDTTGHQKDNPCHHWQWEIRKAVGKIRNLVEGMGLKVNNTRGRREILDGIGRISKFLFGTMDDRDAHEIYQRLQQLEQHDTENMHLIAKQVSVVKSTFSALENSIGNLTQQQMNLEERFDQFTKKIREISEIKAELRAVHIQTDMIEIIVFMLTKLQKLYFQLSEEHAILLALRQHKLHPLILSDKDLSNIYQKVMGTVQSHSFLSDSHLLSQTAEVDYVQIEQKFLIRVTIPLTEAEEYTLNKIFLLPISETNTQHFLLDLDSSYILNNTKNSHYLELTQKEFEDHCQKYSGQLFTRIHICEQSRPKIISNESRQCLIQLLDSSDSNVPTCPHRLLAKVTSYVTRLDRKNAWLFNFQQPIHLSIHCHRRNQKIDLRGVGILTLTEPCSFLLGDTEIPYQRNYENTLPVHQPDTENFPRLRINKEFQSFEKDTNPNPSNRTEFHLKSHGDYNKALRLNSKALEDLQQELSLTELERKTKNQNMHSYLNTTITLVILTVLLLCALVKILLRRRKNGESKPSLGSPKDPESLEMDEADPTRTACQYPQVEIQRLTEETCPHNTTLNHPQVALPLPGFPQQASKSHLPSNSDNAPIFKKIPIPPPPPQAHVGVSRVVKDVSRKSGRDHNSVRVKF